MIYNFILNTYYLYKVIILLYDFYGKKSVIYDHNKRLNMTITHKMRKLEILPQFAQINKNIKLINSDTKTSI